MIIVITEIKVKNIWKYPAFMLHSIRSFNQAKIQDDNIHSSVNGKGMSGFTITAWGTKDKMLQYKNTGNHKLSMKQINNIASMYKTIVYESVNVPTWKEAINLLSQNEYKKIGR